MEKKMEHFTYTRAKVRAYARAYCAYARAYRAYARAYARYAHEIRAYARAYAPGTFPMSQPVSG